MPTSDIKRGHGRVDVTLRTVYYDEIDAEESDSLMSNLSQGGCFIRTGRASPAGTRINIKFKLPDHGQVEAVAIVRWTQESGDEDELGMGVQFDDIRPEDLLALKEFIGKQLEASLLW